MALKYKVASKTEIPAGQEALYVERDGGFVLDVEGAVSKDRLDEFRATNLAYKRQFDELAARYQNIDPELARSLLKAKRDADEAALLGAGNVQAVVEARTQAMRTEFEAQTAAAKRQNAALEARLAELQINQAVVGVAQKRGLRATAATDLVARAKSVFRLVDGQVTPVAEDGSTVRLGKDGVNPLTFDEWVSAVAAEAPHLFESSSGGGAVSSISGGVHCKNPWKKGPDFNLTEQIKIMKADPKLAERLQAAV